MREGISTRGREGISNREGRGYPPELGRESISTKPPEKGIERDIEISVMEDCGYIKASRSFKLKK